MGSLLREKILAFMEKNPLQEYATSTLAEAAFPDIFANIQAILNSPIEDAQAKKKAKEEKAKYHRKVLYYLNELLLEGKIKVTKTTGKGEKHYLLVQPFSSSFGKTNIQVPFLKLKHLQERYPLHIPQQHHLFDKIAALLIDGSQLAKREQLNVLQKHLYPVISDALVIDNLEVLFQRFSLDALHAFFQGLLQQSFHVTFLIDFRKLQDFSVYQDFLEQWLPLFTAQKQSLLIKSTLHELKEYEDVFLHYLSLHKRYKLPFGIINTDRLNVPFFFGNRGHYVPDHKKWEWYIEQENKPLFFLIGFLNVHLDFSMVLEQYRYHKIYAIFHEIIQTLLQVNFAQYLAEQQSLAPLLRLNYPNIAETNLLGANYLRLESLSEAFKERADLLKDFLPNLMHDIDHFVRVERAIFKSCGMPINFDVRITARMKPYLLKKSFLQEQDHQFLLEQESIGKHFRGNIPLSLQFAHDQDPAVYLKLLQQLFFNYSFPLYQLLFHEKIHKTLKEYLNDDH